MDTLFTLKLIIAGIVAGIVAWYLLMHGQSRSEDTIRRWWRRRGPRREEGSEDDPGE